ncbi:MAG TPA: RsiV family protein, partial [Bacteroidales bacterium]
VDSISPNRNIYVNGNGIGFLYNSYEIAPYSTGATNVFLEFSQIKDLLRRGTPVYNMSRR